MTGRLDDVRLDAVLASIGEHLDIDGDAPAGAATPHTNVLPSAATRWSVPSWVVRAAAAVVLVAVAGVMVAVVVAPARETVAGWLGIGSTRLESTSGPADLAGLAFIADDVDPISVDEATRLGVDVGVSDDTPLGRHDWVGAPPEGGVLLGWHEGATTLWIRTGITDDPASAPASWLPLLKQTAAENEVVVVDGLGDAAVLIVGDHVLETPQRRVAAGTVILWVDEGVDHRLESDLDVDRMLAQAHASRAFTDPNADEIGAHIDSDG